MRSSVKIATGFPSATRAAKKLGVSKKVARDLSLLAEHSVETGVYVLPGVGRIVRVGRKVRMGRKPATGEPIKIPANKVVKFRVAKAVKDASAQAKKK